ncbi:MAG: PqqD family peptide modification chaperone, partial [Bdellovibrionales bacterium]|nr:PqqD family peptide modification chaperone [Bdellovibrionales bacterium]
LVSPHSSQGREEKVLGFSVQKIKDAKEPPYFSYLPKWITDANEPIPRSEIMDQVQIRNQVGYELLNTINGKRSRNDIIPLMMNHYKMSQDMAEETLITFLINYYERRV